jgi:hypothetical protein
VHFDAIGAAVLAAIGGILLPTHDLFDDLDGLLLGQRHAAVVGSSLCVRLLDLRWRKRPVCHR